MSEDPEERPVAKRPAPRRPAPERPAVRRARAAGPAPEPPEGSQKRGRSLPRWFWLMLAAELTFIVILVVDAAGGWTDAPAGCFSSVCSLGQGVGIISVVAAVGLGIITAGAFLVIAAGAAQGTRRAARNERERARSFRS